MKQVYAVCQWSDLSGFWFDILSIWPSEEDAEQEKKRLESRQPIDEIREGFKVVMTYLCNSSDYDALPDVSGVTATSDTKQQTRSEGEQVNEPVASSCNRCPWPIERDTLLKMTMMLDEHPEGYEGPCLYKLCQSYMTPDI